MEGSGRAISVFALKDSVKPKQDTSDRTAGARAKNQTWGHCEYDAEVMTTAHCNLRFHCPFTKYLWAVFSIKSYAL